MFTNTARAYEVWEWNAFLRWYGRKISNPNERLKGECVRHTLKKAKKGSWVGYTADEMYAIKEDLV